MFDWTRRTHVGELDVIVVPSEGIFSMASTPRLGRGTPPDETMNDHGLRVPRTADIVRSTGRAYEGLEGGLIEAS